MLVPTRCGYWYLLTQVEGTRETSSVAACLLPSVYFKKAPRTAPKYIRMPSQALLRITSHPLSERVDPKHVKWDGHYSLFPRLFC